MTSPTSRIEHILIWKAESPANLLRDQRVRFLAVGTFNTLFGYLVFGLLELLVFDGMRTGYLGSVVGSYAVSIVLAFFLYRRFVFVVRGRLLRDFCAFVAVNLFAIGTNLGILAVLVELVGLPPLVAQAAALLATTFISYVGHRQVSFRRVDSRTDSPRELPQP